MGHKHRIRSSVLALLVAVAVTATVALPSHAQGGSTVAIPQYKPPVNSAAKTRVTGGTRGVAAKFKLNILAPEHTGLTINSQPTLYWHATYAKKARVEVMILDEDSDDPIYEGGTTARKALGVHGLSLADQGVELEPDVEYQWSVILTPDGEDDFDELFASGTIQLVEATDNLETQLDGAPEADHVNIYAQESIWYDAINSVSEQIEASPGNAGFRKQRAALLKQVGLKDVADYDEGGN